VCPKGEAEACAGFGVNGLGFRVQGSGFRLRATFTRPDLKVTPRARSVPSEEEDAGGVSNFQVKVLKTL